MALIAAVDWPQPPGATRLVLVRHAEPDEAFRGRWAREILSRAMAKLRLEVSSEDLALLGGQARPDLSVTDRKNRLFRLRARLRECLRREILPSVDRAEDVDSEIRELFAAFS